MVSWVFKPPSARGELQLDSFQSTSICFSAKSLCALSCYLPCPTPSLACCYLLCLLYLLVSPNLLQILRSSPFLSPPPKYTTTAAAPPPKIPTQQSRYRKRHQPALVERPCSITLSQEVVVFPTPSNGLPVRHGMEREIDRMQAGSWPAYANPLI